MSCSNSTNDPQHADAVSISQSLLSQVDTFFDDAVMDFIDSCPGYVFERSDELVKAWRSKQEAKRASPDDWMWPNVVLDKALRGVFWNGCSNFQVDHMIVLLDNINAAGEIVEDLKETDKDTSCILEFCIEIAIDAAQAYLTEVMFLQQHLL